MRLSVMEIRVVPNMPDTLAEMRFDCFDALNSYTSVAGMPLARASDRISAFTGPGFSGSYLLNSGAINTGDTAITITRNTIAISQPHTHQKRPAARIAA